MLDSVGESHSNRSCHEAENVTISNPACQVSRVDPVTLSAGRKWSRTSFSFLVETVN